MPSTSVEYETVAVRAPQPPKGKPLTVTSESFSDGGEIGLEYVSEGDGGKNRSPQLTWSGAPPGTKSFAITCFDPDAPTGIGVLALARVGDSRLGHEARRRRRHGTLARRRPQRIQRRRNGVLRGAWSAEGRRRPSLRVHRLRARRGNAEGCEREDHGSRRHLQNARASARVGLIDGALRPLTRAGKRTTLEREWHPRVVQLGRPNAWATTAALSGAELCDERTLLQELRNAAVIRARALVVRGV